MMDNTTMIRELRAVAEKERGKHRDTFELCVDVMATDAANAIEALQAELTALREAARWIPVSERLPKEKDETQPMYDMDTLAEVDVKHFMASDLVLVSVLNEDGERLVCDDVTVDGKWSNFPFDVTHWQELPAPPKEDA